MNTEEFIDTARRFGMGVGGGIDSHSDKWRVVVHSRVAQPHVIPFASEAEALAFMNERHDWAAMAPEWSCARIEHPDGYTPPPPRRLPIAGRSRTEERIIVESDSWHFGQWLLERRGRVRKYARLVDFIDEEQDPYDVSLNDVEELLREWRERDARWADGERDDLEDDEIAAGDEVLSPFEREFGWELECLVIEFDEARTEWLRSKGLRPRIHHCRETDEWSVLATPIGGGVYFLASMAPTPTLAVKIGWSQANIARRIADLRTAHPWELRIVAWIHGASRTDESALHRRFQHLKIQGSPGDEWFSLTGELAAFVKELRGRLAVAA